MSRRVADERGEMSLMGLLVACSLSIVVLFATLTTYDTYAEGQQETSVAVDAQDRARSALDSLARELRNLASPTHEQPEAFDAAGPYDIVFKTVDGNGPNAGSNALNVKRVRYCLQTTNPENASLIAQTQTWTTAAPPAVPSTAACPGGGWAKTEVMATAVTNRSKGQNRRLFTVNAADLPSISAIHADLMVDIDTAAEPPETTLSTGVFLRNQNRKPSAAFTATPTAQGVLLNGSASVDPEGEPLEYSWYSGATKVGSGIVFTLPATSGTVLTLQLRVTDPAGLEGVSAAQVVTA